MEPAYHNLQFVVLDKHRNKQSITRGDVIAFYCEGLDATLVKRVVGIPGDKVVIADKVLYVNDEAYKDAVF